MRHYNAPPKPARDRCHLDSPYPLRYPNLLGRGPGSPGINRGLAIRTRGHQPFFWLAFEAGIPKPPRLRYIQKCRK